MPAAGPDMVVSFQDGQAPRLYPANGAECLKLMARSRIRCVGRAPLPRPANLSLTRTPLHSFLGSFTHVKKGLSVLPRGPGASISPWAPALLRPLPSASRTLTSRLGLAMGLGHDPTCPPASWAGFRFLGQPSACEQTLVFLGPGPSDSGMRADRASTFLPPSAWAAPTPALICDSARTRSFSVCWYQGLENLGEAGGPAADGAPACPSVWERERFCALPGGALVSCCPPACRTVEPVA